jgi:RimJ/RimL family protein N-acetyltransferase
MVTNMEGEEAIRQSYPKTLTVDDATLTLRLMELGDRDQILAFARALPPDDLLFLRRDITTTEGVDEWVYDIRAGRMVTVLAEHEGGLAGYASISHSATMWNRHLGEIRVNIAPRFRRHGLGRRLVDEVFSVARSLNLRKITVQMTPDQKGARATFERLGFRPEALLADFVVDREGRTRDLLIMSHDLAGFTDVQYAGARARARSS